MTLWSVFVIAYSHRRRPHRWCNHNCRDNIRQFFLASTQFRWVLSRLDPVSNFQVFSNPRYIWDSTAANWKPGRDKTKLIETGSRQDKTHRNWVDATLNCLVLLPVEFTPPTRTRPDSFVSSVSPVWTSY